MLAKDDVYVITNIERTMYIGCDMDDETLVVVALYLCKGLSPHVEWEHNSRGEK